MYTSHFGLTAKPFSIVPDPNILFLGKTYENALTYLEYGLSEKVGFILLTGEVGIGKTTLIRHMLNKMPSQMDIAVIFNTNFTSDQLFRGILNEFELPCDTTDKSVQLETLYHFLIEQFAQGRHTLLVIDEAQNLSDAVLEDIRLLFNLQTDNKVLLQIILVGQPDLKRRMSDPNLRQLAQRIVVNYHLTPLTEEQTSQYIHFRLQAAGATENLFSKEALALIYKKSEGIPRTINLICDAGLTYGYGDDKTFIDHTIIENVLKDGVYLTAETKEPALPTNAAPATSEAAPNMMDRITAIESALAELQCGQQKLAQEIRSELNQKLENPKTELPESGHSHPDDEDMGVKADTYAFKDSAGAHAIGLENEGTTHETMFFSDTDHQFSAEPTNTNPSVLKTSIKKIDSDLDPADTRTRRSAAHRYLLWIILLLIPLIGLWIMMARENSSSKHYTLKPGVDAPPSLGVVNMNYDDLSTSPELEANQKKETEAPIQKEETEIIHTVQSGETLLSIAKHYNIPAKTIKKANNITNSHLIYAGQKLKIQLAMPDKNR